MEPDRSCSECGTALDANALSCPACHAFVHAAELETLTRNAQIAANSGNMTQARDYWSKAAALLPPETLQYKSVQARISELDIAVKIAEPAGQGAFKKAGAALGPAAVVLWKFKALLLGLTKITTLLTMFASFGIYWSLYGWAFALGLVLSIYVHEMGHVIELRRFGIPAGAPMFIPGLGAIIQLRGVSLPPVQDCRIGLAGPIYGLGAALFCALVYLATGQEIWAAIAATGAMINLFNLIPIWQLDGARGFHSFSRNQRIGVLGLALIGWIATRNGMLFLIAIGSGYQLFKRDAASEPDSRGFLYFAGLLAALTALEYFMPAR